MIALSGPRVIGDGQDGFDFLAVEKTNEPLNMSFERNAQDAWECWRELRAEPVAQIVNKRANGCETSVAGPGTVAALVLQMIQEPENGIGRQDVQWERCSASGMNLAQITEQQAEGVRIRGERGGTDVALGGEVLPEKSLQIVAQFSGLWVHRVQSAERRRPVVEAKP